MLGGKNVKSANNDQKSKEDAYRKALKGKKTTPKC